MEGLPLVVDLDGTVIRGDTLFESANTFIFSKPSGIFQLFGYASKGKPQLKNELASRISLEPELLPYNSEVLSYIKAARDKGRYVVLATASNEIPARKIANYLDLFDEVIASDEKKNLKSSNKAKVLVERFGQGAFEYVGDSDADISVWNASGAATFVASGAKYAAKVSQEIPKKFLVPEEKISFVSKIAKMMRLHQWAKNLLIFLPLIVIHEVLNGPKLMLDLLAFVAFGLAASSIYIVNDLIDVNNDRAHASKRKRMFASGQVSLLAGWLCWPFLLMFSFGISTFLPVEFSAVLALYVVTTVAYSLKLKKIAVLDVVVLAGLYTLRIVAGAAAISAPLSFWIMTFSLFLFLSLALMKRFSELQDLREQALGAHIKGRGYHEKDLELVSSLGAASGLIAVLVFMLYVQDPKVIVLYQSPALLWLTGPLLLLWIARAWLIAHRGDMHDDPIVFAIRDIMSYLIGMCIFAVFVGATFL